MEEIKGTNVLDNIIKDGLTENEAKNIFRQIVSVIS